MTPREHELLEGLGNCYAACGEDFDNTIKMVARARGLEPGIVKVILKDLKEKYSRDSEYQQLRNRLPAEFPL